MPTKPRTILPFLPSLAPSERFDVERKGRHKTLPDWARQLLLVVRRWYPERAIVAVAESTDAALDRLAACRSRVNPVTVVTRLRPGTRVRVPALSAPALPREPGQVGRPRRKGQRLPTLATVANDPQTVWRSVTVADWYGQGERTVEVASASAVWYHGGMPAAPLRWILIRDPTGAFATKALRCTDQDATPEQLLAWFVLRWQLEVTWEETRRQLGLETQRPLTPAGRPFGPGHPPHHPRLARLVLPRHAPRPPAGGTDPTPVRRAACYPKALPTAVGASLMRSPWCAANAGSARVLPCPLVAPIAYNSPAHSWSI